MGTWLLAADISEQETHQKHGRALQDPGQVDPKTQQTVISCFTALPCALEMPVHQTGPDHIETDLASPPTRSEDPNCDNGGDQVGYKA